MSSLLIPHVIQGDVKNIVIMQLVTTVHIAQRLAEDKWNLLLG
jgi:hypothetical protein